MYGAGAPSTGHHRLEVLFKNTICVLGTWVMVGVATFGNWWKTRKKQKKTFFYHTEQANRRHNMWSKYIVYGQPFLLESHGGLLSVSFLVCFSLSLSVAVRLSGCIPDKKLLNKGINTAICEIKRNSNVSRRYMSWIKNCYVLKLQLNFKTLTKCLNSD